MRRNPSATSVRLCFSMQRILLRSWVILTRAIDRPGLRPDPEQLADRLSARGGDFARLAKALKSVHRGLHDVVGVSRSERLRENVVDARRLEDGAHRAPRDH